MGCFKSETFEVVVAKIIYWPKNSVAISMSTEYVYDPEHIMQKFTVQDLLKRQQQLVVFRMDAVTKFAEQFQSADFAKTISGSGPYRLVA